MKKKKFIVLPVFAIVATVVYFVFFYQDKKLKQVPKTADVVVLVDIKKLTRQYISSYVTYPSQWFGGEKKDNKTTSLQESGIRIPDFLSIFHIKDTRFSDWYTVIELKDQQKFLAFLKERKFVNAGGNLFRKEQMFIKIDGENCILGTSDRGFQNIEQHLLKFSEKESLNTDDLIHNTLGSISFISEHKIQNLSIELRSDDIEITNTLKSEAFNSLLSKLQQKNQFLDIEMDAKNIKDYTSFFNKNLEDSIHVNYFKATADLQQVNDTIVSYGYDDNFNEIEKRAYQKITQPNYIIALQSSAPERMWEYFQFKKWINTQDQFTAIPFQPNYISKNKEEVIIRSTRTPLQLSTKQGENYIFIKNSELLTSSLEGLFPIGKKIISSIDYVFYGNKVQDHYLKIKGKKDDLPLILRW